MPNHVTNKIVFSADKTEEVFSFCCPEGRFDFSTLVPEPITMYRGGLNATDQKDFPCNWLSWSRENWGTKWNAYDSSCCVDGDTAAILFNTAWSVPYPILVAFANKFLIKFEHRYFDEGHNFWGIEEWDVVDGLACRVMARKSYEEDKIPLCVELRGYDPTSNNESDTPPAD